MLDRIGSAFIGVVDLFRGKAVHAVAGQRDAYRPCRRFYPPDGPPIAIDGDGRKLIRQYRSIGISSIYLADLEGIGTGICQRDHVDTLVSSSFDANLFLLDLGIRDSPSDDRYRWLESLLERHPKLILVVATESAKSVGVLNDLAERFSPQRLAISFDYKDAAWLSASTTEHMWLDACRQAKIQTVIGLDLAGIGGRSIAQSERLCKRLRPQLPECHFVTGGGVRSEADALRLLQAGANQLLVASLFAR